MHELLLELHPYLGGGSLFELFLIFLAFFAGRAGQYRESLYLLMFLLKLGMWMVQKSPENKRKYIESQFAWVIDHIHRHHFKQPEPWG